VVLAVVADGMGGHTGGAMAAQQVVSTAQQIFENFSTKDETPQKLLTSIVHESHLIITLSSYTSEQEPHSTVVALLLQKDRADWRTLATAGFITFANSLWCSAPSTIPTSNSYTKKARLLRPRRKPPNKNILVHCLGGQNPPLIDFGGTDKLEPDDCFILCSDGLWPTLRTSNWRYFCPPAPHVLRQNN